MNKNLLAIAGASCLLLAGCIDDNYDLSDIDTTSEVKVDNLTLPINIDSMRLDNVFKLEDNSNIRIVEENGDRFYALSQSGSFKSEPIEINAIHIDAPHIAPTHTDLTLPFNSQRRKAPMADIAIPSSATPFTYETYNIDPAIYGMDAVYTKNTTLTITATVEGTDISAVDFKDMQFQLPFGMKVSNLTTGSYNPKNGIWSIPHCKSSNGRDVSVSLNVDMMELTSKNPTLTFNKEKLYMRIDGTLGLKEGTAQLDLGALGQQHPHNMAINIRYTLSDIDVAGLSGNIEYYVEDLGIDPVSIGDLPDFLKGEGTNIRIANPQLYLSLNNPVGDQNLRYQTGFRLTAVRNNGTPDLFFAPDNNAGITVGSAHGITGPYNFLLAPQQVKAPAEFQQNLSFVKFSSLSDILAVPEADAAKATLPDLIRIEAIDPGLPDQHADNFPLGRKLLPIEGKYELIAPLGFKEGSIVIYEDTEDGWSTEDLEKMTITAMTVTATVDNDAPVSAQLESYPIDTAGNQINSVTVSSNVVKANAKDQPLTISINGTVRNLDGIHIRAIMRSSDNSTPLSPDQSLTFKNVRVTVSGSYTKEF